MAFGVTSTGFVLKTLNDIIAAMEANAKIQFGNDVDLTSTSPLEKFIQVVAAEQTLLWQQLEAAYYAGYFDSASADALDKLTVLLGFIRNAAVKATGQVTFTGVNGTLIPANTEVQTPGSSPIVFKTATPVTIASGTATANITAKVAGASGNISANTISVLTAPISGVSAVNNTSATTGGADKETDSAYRNRIKLSLNAAGAATLDAIRSGVLGVTNVRSCALEENDTITDNTPAGLPPKSFRVTVLDGANNSIAQAIFDNKPAGIRSYGDQSGNAVAKDGTVYVIWFRRPTEKTIYVDVVLTKDGTFPTDGNAQVKNAVIAYIGGIDLNGKNNLGLNIGNSVVFNKVVDAVMGIQGVTDAVVKIGLTTPPTGTSNITIAATEKATCTTSTVTVA